MRTAGFVADALHAAWVRPGRAAALAAAAALATGLVVASLGIAATASAQVSDRFDARRNREVTLTAGLGPGEQAGEVDLVPADAEARVRRVAGVEAVGVMRRVDQVALARAAPAEPQPTAAIAVSAGWFAVVGAEVRWATGHPAGLGPREVVVGARVAEALSLAAVDDDPTVLVDGVRFGVAGVLRSVERVDEAVDAVLLGEVDATEVAAPASEAIVLVGTASGAAPQVARLAPIALDPTDPERFDVDAPPDPGTLRAEVESDVTTSLLVMTAVAFVAAVVGIGNAMTMSVLERIDEIGLRRAIGARSVHVLAQVTVESASIGLVGGVIGLYGGVAALLGVTASREWQPVLDLRLVPLALVCGTAAGVVGGLAAGLRAVRILPSEALRR